MTKKSTGPFSLAIVLTGTASLIAALVVAEPAFAGKDKGKSSSKSESRSSKSSSSSKPKKEPKERAQKSQNAAQVAKQNGTHASDLGALNAAHASATARANASSNSRVGLIAQYEEELGITISLKSDLDTAVELLAAIPVPDRSSDDVQMEIDTKSGELSTKQTNLAILQGLVGDPAAPADLDDQIAVLEGEILTLTQDLTDLGAEKSAAETYEAAAGEVSRLEGEYAIQEQVLQETLEAAANKPVTPEIEDELQRLLGVFEELLPTTEPSL